MAQMQMYFQKFLTNVQKGIWPYVATVAHILLGTILVYSDSRSIIAFLILITSFFSLYYLKADNRFKLITGIILALVLLFPDGIVGGLARLATKFPFNKARAAP